MRMFLLSGLIGLWAATAALAGEPVSGEVLKGTLAAVGGPERIGQHALCQSQLPRGQLHTR